MLREHISSLWSFFSSGNNQHITQYQDIIHKHAEEISELDNTINYQELKLLELKKDVRYHRIKERAYKEYQETYYNRVRKNKMFDKELLKITSTKKLFYYDPKRESILQKLHEKFDDIIIEPVLDKPVVIDRTGKFIVEL